MPGYKALFPKEVEVEEAERRAARRGGAACSALRQFICVLDNGETFVTWAETKEEATDDCTKRAFKPWRVLMTDKRMPNTSLQGTGHLVDRTLQGVVGTPNRKGET